VYGQATPRGCERWHSLTRPPDTIRVLRTRSNNVQTVSFRRYVAIVMSKEWPSYLPQAVVEAGAVAVKQYAWYHALYTTRSSKGGCFDVKDGTGDQIYRPRNNRPTSDHHRALDATWGVSLRKHGNFFMTAYRRGAKVRCGRDSNGNRLYALSAKHCAERHHYGWRQILREYYGNVQFVEGGGGSGTRSSSYAPGATQDTSAPEAATYEALPLVGTAHIVPGLLPENASFPADPAVSDATAATAAGAATTATTAATAGAATAGAATAARAAMAPVTSAPVGDPPAAVVDTAIHDTPASLSGMAHPSPATPVYSTWIALAMAAAVASVGLLLKRRRGYLR
jgi:hypothetical protein